jgi:hypothetical protein
MYLFVTRFFHAVWKLITGGGNAELNSLMKGIQADLSELNFEKVGQQLGSGLSAVVAVNIVGTLFLKSPGLIAIVCFVGGVIWPTWIGGAYKRLTKKISDTTSKGRRVMLLNKSASEGGQYNYFIRGDGTKRWYRTAGKTSSSFLDGFMFFKVETGKSEQENNTKSFLGVFRRKPPSTKNNKKNKKA